MGQLHSSGPVTSEASRKTVSSLRALIADFRAEGFTRDNARQRRAHERFSSKRIRMDAAGRVHVYVSLAETGEAALEALRAHGMEIEIVNHGLRIVQGWVAIDDLDNLTADPLVLTVRPPGYGQPRASPVTTEGDAVHRCDAVRAWGLAGRGVKVGVVSDGVAGLATAQAAGELPEVEILSRDVGSEGTAVLEIVHDCAPGAALAFAASGSTTLTFIEAVNTLRTAGAAVIVDDIFFLSEPYFEDGDVARNDRVAGNAVVRVSAAGNDAEAHYQGVFVPGGPGGKRHNFGGGDTLLRAQVPFGAPFIVVLQWDNPFGGAGDDYDLFVRHPSGTIIGSSQDAQTGQDDPLEIVLTSPCAQPSGCLADIEVVLFDGIPRTLELFCFGCQFLEFNVRRDSVFGHPAVPEVLAVAAAPADDPTTLESYSSPGPSTIQIPFAETRFKPDLTAVDCVATSRPGFAPFCGTSAAAPHVAAVAALVIEALGPAWTPAMVRDILKQSAVDLGPAGPDTDFGFGRVDALNAVGLAWAPQVSLSVTLSTHDVGPGGTTTVDIGVANPGGPATVDIYLVEQVPAAQGVALGCPAGDALLFFSGAAAPTVVCGSTPPPVLPAIATGVAIPPALGPVAIPGVLQVAWPPGLPAGTYAFALALLRAGAFADGIIDPGEVVAIGIDSLTYRP